MTDTARRRWERRMMLGGNAIPGNGEAQERWVRRMMTRSGARPLGHADPSEEEGPQVPTTPVPDPAPPVPSAPPVPQVPQQKAHVPDWWSPQRPDVTTLGKQDGTDQAPEDDPVLTVEEDSEAAEEESDDDAAVKEPVRHGPATEKPKRGGKEKTRPHRKLPHAGAEALRQDPRMRWVAFTGSAAYVGHAFGLDRIVRGYLPFAEQAAVGTFGLVLAATAGWAAWKVTSAGAILRILPFPPISRTLLVVGAAEIGRRLGPVPVAYLNAYGQDWGLGPSTVSLLVTAVGFCGLLWWFIDRPLRRKGVHWSVRWMFRIPLASALLACLPYETGSIF